MILYLTGRHSACDGQFFTRALFPSGPSSCPLPGVLSFTSHTEPQELRVLDAIEFCCRLQMVMATGHDAASQSLSSHSLPLIPCKWVFWSGVFGIWFGVFDI